MATSKRSRSAKRPSPSRVRSSSASGQSGPQQPQSGTRPRPHNAGTRKKRPTRPQASKTGLSKAERVARARDTKGHREEEPRGRRSNRQAARAATRRKARQRRDANQSSQRSSEARGVNNRPRVRG